MARNLCRFLPFEPAGLSLPLSYPPIVLELAAAKVGLYEDKGHDNANYGGMKRGRLRGHKTASASNKDGA
jgi:hypothetical protein